MLGYPQTSTRTLTHESLYLCAHVHWHTHEYISGGASLILIDFDEVEFEKY